MKISLSKCAPSKKLKMIMDIETALDASDTLNKEDHARLLDLLDANECGQLNKQLYEELSRLVEKYAKIVEADSVTR
jgi:hypothetical protein